MDPINVIKVNQIDNINNKKNIYNKDIDYNNNKYKIPNK